MVDFFNHSAHHGYIAKQLNCGKNIMSDIVFILILVWAGTPVHCQGGRQYSISFMEHKRNGMYKVTIDILNSATTTANVFVSNNAMVAFPNNTYTIAGEGGYQLVVFNSSSGLSPTIDKKCVITVSSDVDVYVIVSHYAQFMFDGFLAVPDLYASTLYTVICYCKESIDQQSDCTVAITSLANPTRLVFIMPGHSITLKTGSLGLDWQTEFLPMEQVEEIVGPGETLFISGNDFTGMKINSSEPVHVLAGNNQGTFYDSNNIEFHETIMLPEDKWGSAYIIVRLYSPSDRIWIFAAENDTNIKMRYGANSTEELSIKNSATYLEYIVTEQVYIVTADKRIGVVHFTTQTPTSVKFSAYFVIPIKLFGSQAVFQVPYEDYDELVAMAVVYTETKWINYLTHNGNVVNATWEQVLCSEMSFAFIEISLNESHVVTQHGPGGKIGGYMLVSDKYSLWSYHIGVNRIASPGDADETDLCSNTEEFFSTRSIPIIPYSEHFRSPDTTLTTQCFCDCQTVGTSTSRSTSSNTSVSEPEAEIQELQKEMTIDKRMTSRTRRTKTSADDSRKSSSAIGFVAAILITSMFSIFALSDLRQIFTDVTRTVTSLRSCKKCRTCTDKNGSSNIIEPLS